MTQSRAHQNKPSESPDPSPKPPLLGFSPKCRYALCDAMRPRAVRTRKPCWIRYGSITYSRDRKSVVEGKGVAVRVDLGGRRVITKTKDQKSTRSLNHT